MLDRRKFLLGTCGSLASLMGLNRDLSFAQAERPPWIHEGTLHIAKFVMRGKKVLLYTVGDDVVCACWEMPSCKLVEKFEAPFLRAGRLAELGFMPEFIESPCRPSFAGGFAMGIFQGNLDSDVCFLHIERRRWYRVGQVYGIRPLIGCIAPDRLAYSVSDDENQGRLVIQTAILRDDKLLPDKRCYLPIQMGWPIYWDYRGDTLRLLYAGFGEKSFQEIRQKLQNKQLLHLEPEESSRLLKDIRISQKIYLATFNLQSNKFVESRLVYPSQEIERDVLDKRTELSVSRGAYNPADKKLYVLTSRNYLVLSADGLNVETEVPLTIRISILDKKDVPLTGYLSVVDTTGQYLAVPATGIGRVCVVNLSKRTLVLDDNTHETRVLRTFENVAFPLAVGQTAVLDMMFIPETPLLAMITGTGDLYLYNVEKGRLERRVVLAQSFLK
jgi:hypothetical protein